MGEIWSKTCEQGRDRRDQLASGRGLSQAPAVSAGNIRDERLYQTWKKEKKVKWLRPEQGTDEWFNMFVLHQNRIAHDAKKCIHEDMLPTFLDFIVWGHEHEAKPREEEGGTENTSTIYQPGSTVATSLCEGEAKKKAVGVLEIYKDTIRFKVILPTASGVAYESRSSPLLVLAPPFLGPGFWLGARWNRLVEAVKTRKKRGETGGNGRDMV